MTNIPDLVQRLRAIDEHEAHRWPRRVVAECQTAADAIEAREKRIAEMEALLLRLRGVSLDAKVSRLIDEALKGAKEISANGNEINSKTGKTAPEEISAKLRAAHIAGMEEAEEIAVNEDPFSSAAAAIRTAIAEKGKG